MTLSTILNLEFTGADGATSTFSDSSGQGHTATGNNASISGNKLSLSGPSFNSLIYMADHADFAFGTDDFTITIAALRPTTVTGNIAIFEQYNWTGSVTNGNELISLTHNASTGFKLLIKDGGTAIVNQTSGPAMTANNNYDIELKKVGTALTLKVNGSTIISTTLNVSMPDCTNAFYIGRSDFTGAGGLNFTGTMDNFKIERGEAESPADFPPPGSELDVWVQLADGNYVCRYAPGLGVDPSGNPQASIYVNSVTGLGLTTAYCGLTFPMSSLTDWLPNTWNTLALSLFGIPSTAKYIDINGHIGITMGTTSETSLLRMWFIHPDYITDEDCFRTMAVSASQGVRTPVAARVFVKDGFTKFAWNSTSPNFNLNGSGNPIYGTALIHLNIIGWGE